MRRTSELAERLTIRIARGRAQDPESVKGMLLQDPGIIEEGVTVLDGSLRAGTGGLIDLLASDASGSLVLVVIERESEDELLLRLLDQYDWVASQGPFLRRLYGAGRIHPLRGPRIFALSHRFSPVFLRRLANLRIPVTPLVYRVLHADGEAGLYLEPPEEGTGREEIEAPRAAGTEAERLTAEELEAFYRFEHDRERMKEAAGD